MVQGVGFRYTTRRLAQDFEVFGCVRNLADGRVELVVEGEPEQIDGLVQTVQQTMRSYIRESTCSESTPTGEYRGFSIAL